MDDQPLDQSSLYLLGQIDAKVTSLIESQRLQREEISKSIDGVYERIDREATRTSALEKSMWKMAGVAAVVPTVIAAAGVAIAVLQ